MKKIALFLILLFAVLGLCACDDVPALFTEEVDKSALETLLTDFKTVPQTLDQATVVTAYSLVYENDAATQKEVNEAVSALKTLKQTIYSTQMSFIDGGLEPHVRRALNFEEDKIITIGDCISLQELDCTYDKTLGPKIRVAYDFRYFPNLKVLNLTGNNLQDLGGFAYLKQLEELSLADNPSKTSTLSDDEKQDVRSFDILGKLPLRRLDLSGESVLLSVSSLPIIPTLEELDLSKNTLSSLEAVGTKFPNLKVFTARDCVLGELKDLAFCSQLTTLDLSRSSVNDFAFLEHLQALSVLTLDGVAISDLSALTKAPHLTSLSLSGCGITELSWISGFRSLESLNLSNNQIADAALTVGKTTTKEVNLSRNVLTSFVLNDGWSAVERLNLSENKLTAFSVDLSGECSLKVLNLASNSIATFDVGDAASLESLDLSANQLSGFSLSSKSLMSLSLSENPLTGLTLDLPALASLDLACQTQYAQGITWNLPSLKLLDMSKEFQCSVNVLQSLSGLETLSVHLSGVTTESIVALSSLKTLTLYGADDAAVSQLAGLPALETLILSGGTLSAPRLDGTSTLKSLSVEKCNLLTDLSGIKNLPVLESLTVQDGNLPAPAVSDLPQLRTLTLSGCNLSSVSYLTNLPSLTSLNLSGNGFQSIEVLGFSRLQFLDLSDNKLSSVEGIALEITKGTLDLSGNEMALYNDLSSFPDTLKIITE